MHPLPPLAIAALALLTLGYLATCMIWPFTSCRRCNGTGKLRSPFGGRAVRMCTRCKATGLRLRTGRLVINHLHTAHRDARARDVRTHIRRDIDPR